MSSPCQQRKVTRPHRDQRKDDASSRRRLPTTPLTRTRHIAPEEPAKPPTAALSAFERGIAALAQHKTREGTVKVPRSHIERLEDGTEVRLGVWIMNQKGRRAKLTTDKLAALADLGLEWAATEGAA
ncbi:helicase associated domain-containing protein [Streptomyces griseoincarnatus]